MFFEKLVTERFSLSDVNRQVVINYSTHEAKGLASILSFNSREHDMDTVEIQEGEGLHVTWNQWGYNISEQSVPDGTNGSL